MSIWDYEEEFMLRPSKRRRLNVNQCGMINVLQVALQALPSAIVHIVHDYASNPQAPVAAGGGFTVVRVADGTLQGFGMNNYGQLGDDINADRPFPIAIPAIHDTKGVAAGQFHTIVLMADGSLLGFGQNCHGQLGDGLTATCCRSPVTILGIHNAEAVACGATFTVVLLADGTLRAFGSNGYGQLGDGSRTQRESPVEVLNVRDAEAVACGGHHTVVLIKDGTLRSFGDNDEGQLGDGTTTERLTPIVVPNISNVVQIACGFHHTVVLLRDGTIRTFGSNAQGQLGNGLTTYSPSPVLVPNITHAKYVACSRYQSTFVVMEDGSVQVFGQNDCGQLGNGSISWQVSPIQVDLQRISAVFGGFSHTIVLLEDGTLRAFGANDAGQLGDGSTNNHHWPVVAPGLRVF